MLRPYQAAVPFDHEDQRNDPVRIARDHWLVQHTNILDSSEIIDSIDVDMVDASEDINVPEIYLVIDTNIFIQHLHVLKQAIVLIEADPVRLNLIMLVPGIVVSELDFQKNSTKSIAIESRKASGWLAEGVLNVKGRVKGQAYMQTMLPSGDWRQRSGLSNDELILDCCKYFSHVKRKDVLLLTSDNNLAVQASANAMNLFLRGASAVIRPPRGLWDVRQLLDCVVPGCSGSTAASIHAFGLPHGNRVTEWRRNVNSDAIPYFVRGPEDDACMEVDMDDRHTTLNEPQGRTPKDHHRDILHRQMTHELSQQLRKLTGKAATLQKHRREHESVYSPANINFTGKLPMESDWSGKWCLRECLAFLVKISPPQPRSWIFGEGEASSLADFLGLPGEKGARPGKEWAKHDWWRELQTVQKLTRDFDFELDQLKFAEYEYAVKEAFTVTDMH